MCAVWLNWGFKSFKYFTDVVLVMKNNLDDCTCDLPVWQCNCKVHLCNSANFSADKYALAAYNSSNALLKKSL